MSGEEIDAYLAGMDEPARSTLDEVRRRILEVVPDAVECISYGVPAFRLDAGVVAGFAAFKTHLSYLPHSGRVLAAVEGVLAGYTRTKGALHFAADEPLPRDLIARLIAARLADLDSAK